MVPPSKDVQNEKIFRGLEFQQKFSPDLPVNQE